MFGMDLLKGLNELGKGFINLGVAFLVFAVIQPFVKNNIDLKTSFVSIMFSSILFIVGVLLSSLGGKKSE